MGTSCHKNYPTWIEISTAMYSQSDLVEFFKQHELVLDKTCYGIYYYGNYVKLMKKEYLFLLSILKRQGVAVHGKNIEKYIGCKHKDIKNINSKTGKQVLSYKLKSHIKMRIKEVLVSRSQASEENKEPKKLRDITNVQIAFPDDVNWCLFDEIADIQTLYGVKFVDFEKYFNYLITVKDSRYSTYFKRPKI